MAQEYFCAYHSYLEWMSELSDAEKGRLFVALLTYSATRMTPTLSGKEAILFPAMKWNIDRDSRAYEEKCERNRANANERYRTDTTASERMPSQATASERMPSQATASDRKRPPAKPAKEKEKEKTKEKESINPLPPSSAETGFGDELQAAFESWLAYKAERKEPYRATGLRSLVSQLRKKSEKYGESALAELIQDCMASGWKGIIYEKLEKPQSAPSGQRRTNEHRDWEELAEQMAAEMEGGLP